MKIIFFPSIYFKYYIKKQFYTNKTLTEKINSKRKTFILLIKHSMLTKIYLQNNQTTTFFLRPSESVVTVQAEYTLSLFE